MPSRLQLTGWLAWNWRIRPSPSSASTLRSLGMAMIGGVLLTPEASKLLASTAELPAKSFALTSRLLPLALRPLSSSSLGSARVHWLGLLAVRLACSDLPLINTVTTWPSSRPVAVPTRVIGLSSGLAAAAAHWASVGWVTVSRGAAVSTVN